MDFLQAAQPRAHTGWAIPHRNHSPTAISHPECLTPVCIQTCLWVIYPKTHQILAKWVQQWSLAVFLDFGNDPISPWMVFHGGIVGVTSAGPGDGLSDPFGSLSTQEILWFLRGESEKGSLFSLEFYHFPPTSFFFFLDRYIQFSFNLCSEYILSPMQIPIPFY